MYSGTIAPLITPLDHHDAVDEASLTRLIDSVAAHVDGLMPALSTGEGWKLDDQQWSDVVGLTVKHAQGLPVLAGIQRPDTSEVIRLAKVAAGLGVDAVVVTTPFGPGVSQAGIEAHYREIRAAVELPIFLYNEEALSGNRIELDTLIRVSGLPGIAGIKESSGSATFTRQLIDARLGIPVFEGWENLLLRVSPVDGFIGPLANLEPRLCAQILTDPTPALQEQIDEACERYGVFEPDWYRSVKRELLRRGVIATDRVLPDSGEPA